MTVRGLGERKSADRGQTPDGFVRDERGSFIIFGIAVFMLMCLAGGIAVDTMRYETHRVHVQGTLDRAVLAAASLDQDLDPEEVVLDYFTKAGLSHLVVKEEAADERAPDRRQRASILCFSSFIGVDLYSVMLLLLLFRHDF